MMGRIFLTAVVVGCLLTGCKSHQQTTTDGQTNVNQTETTMKQKMPQGKLLSVSYNFQGMRRELFRDMELTRVDGKPVIRFEGPYGKREYAVGDSLFDKARTIIEEEKMYEYGTSYAPMIKERLLDGYSWNFSATFEGDEHIYSKGSNAEPDGDGLNKIHRLLFDTCNKFFVAEQ